MFNFFVVDVDAEGNSSIPWLRQHHSWSCIAKIPVSCSLLLTASNVVTDGLQLPCQAPIVFTAVVVHMMTSGYSY